MPSKVQIIELAPHSQKIVKYIGWLKLMLQPGNTFVGVYVNVFEVITKQIVNPYSKVKKPDLTFVLITDKS